MTPRWHGPKKDQGVGSFSRKENSRPAFLAMLSIPNACETPYVVISSAESVTSCVTRAGTACCVWEIMPQDRYAWRRVHNMHARTECRAQIRHNTHLLHAAHCSIDYFKHFFVGHSTGIHFAKSCQRSRRSPVVTTA